MKDLFSIGELAKFQNISKQTLIFYDKIGLFQPAYTDPQNGYRYYSAKQIDYLDTILIMKEMGFSLNEIKTHMQNYTIDTSLVTLRKQLAVLDRQAEHLQLVRNRLARRCEQMESVKRYHEENEPISVKEISRKYLLYSEVEKPYSSKDISIATKKCFSQAFKDSLPIFFQTGDIIPYSHILEERYTEATVAFLPIENTKRAENIRIMPKGRVVSTYHYGTYETIERSYKRLLKFCRDEKLEICSDSYEFCINDYITSGDENEYLTEILFYLK